MEEKAESLAYIVEDAAEILVTNTSSEASLESDSPCASESVNLIDLINEPREEVEINFCTALLQAPVWVGGTQYRTIVDTGTSCSLVGSYVASNLRVVVELCCQRVIFFAGEFDCEGRVVLPFIVGEITFEHVFFVASDNMLQHELLLGADFLASSGITVYSPLGRLSGKTPQGSVWDLYLSKDKVYTLFRKVAVFVEEDTNLQCHGPDRVKIVFDSACCPLLETFFFDGNINQAHI